MYKFLTSMLLLATAGLVGCASAPAQRSESSAADVQPRATYVEPEPLVSCPDESFLRGEGRAATPQQAATLARQEIAAQIQSKIVSVNTLQKNSNAYAGKESLSSSYSINSKVYTTLENAQDAKIVYSGLVGNNYKAVACMSREDAEKPFQRRAFEQRDSLAMAVAAIQQTSHPLRVKELYLAAQKSYGQYTEATSVLNNPVMDAEARELYDAALAIYKDFQSRYRFYYDAGEGEVDEAFFSRISGAYPVTSGECQAGLQLSLDVSDIKCKDGSLGISCSVNLALHGASCSGENYFSLNATVKGSGKYSEDEAKERLLKVVRTGDWFNGWKAELDRWKF